MDNKNYQLAHQLAEQECEQDCERDLADPSKLHNQTYAVPKKSLHTCSG
jgi:hypothetical protein